MGEKLRQIGGEFGVTTGRARRCGWFDAISAKYAVLVGGLSEVALTKLDVLDSGADDFLSEPIESEEFKARINDMLASINEAQ